MGAPMPKIESARLNREQECGWYESVVDVRAVDVAFGVS